MKKLFMIAAMLAFGGCAGEAVGADPVKGVSQDGFAHAAPAIAAGGVIVTCAVFCHGGGGNGTTGTLGGGAGGTAGSTGTH